MHGECTVLKTLKGLKRRRPSIPPNLQDLCHAPCQTVRCARCAKPALRCVAPTVDGRTGRVRHAAARRMKALTDRLKEAEVVGAKVPSLGPR